jgi:tetratricopeptide (TPR) repeat protein
VNGDLRFTIRDLRGFGRWRAKIIFVALFFTVNFSRGATNDYFAEGVTAYRAGLFPEAAAAFQKSVQAHPAAGTFINLGLAEWQRGHAGAAMVAWEKARWLNPFDNHAAENLEFARAVAQVEAPPLKWFETASTWLPPDTWVWLAGGGLWLAIGALVLPRLFRRRKSSRQHWLAAVGFGIFVFSMTANVGVVSRAGIGLVLPKETPLRLMPTQTAEIIAILPAGQPARKLRAKGNYFLIRTEFGIGWIARDEFGVVATEN